MVSSQEQREREINESFFVRHGEGMDDIENRYGGWADLDLSPKGVEGAKKTGEYFKKIDRKIDLILSSPLKRALETAEGIAREIDAPVKTLVYLKERNTYGLLSGENKDGAKKNYPDLVDAYDKGKEVLGYENYDFFLKRVRKMIEKLSFLKQKTVICVTHGKLLAALFKDILGIGVEEFHDNCIAEIDINKDGKLTLIKTEGIDLA